MGNYCASCNKNVVIENSSFKKTKQNDMLLSSCAVYGKKKLTFIKNQELNNFNNIFEMFTLKWIKLSTNFYWLETNLCQNGT